MPQLLCGVRASCSHHVFTQSLPKPKRGSPHWSPVSRPPRLPSKDHLPSCEHRGTAALLGPGCLLVITQDCTNGMSKWHVQMLRWEKKIHQGQWMKGEKDQPAVQYPHAGWVCTSLLAPQLHQGGAAPLSWGRDLRAGCRIPRHGPQLTLPCSVWCRTAGEVWSGSAIPVPSSSPASPPREEERRVLSPSQGPASLPPLLSLSLPLFGAAPAPTSSQTLLHPKLPAALPGPAEDDKGRNATLSAPLPACHQLTPYCSICSPLCTGCIIVVDKRHVCWWTRERSSIHLSCPGLVQLFVCAAEDTCLRRDAPYSTVWFPWYRI